tara:strand:+ start:221 stop:577 length:357 start_codon:yes stop_codon:yes gene_type:complete
MKRYKFTTKFKNSVKDVMSELGLDEIKTKRQKNGTLMFEDPETESVYGLYESGYCRRLVPIDIHWGTSQIINGKNYTMYQLNKTYSIDSRHKARLFANPIEQLGLVVSAITRIRKTNI